MIMRVCFFFDQTIAIGTIFIRYVLKMICFIYGSSLFRLEEYVSTGPRLLKWAMEGWCAPNLDSTQETLTLHCRDGVSVQAATFFQFYPSWHGLKYFKTDHTEQETMSIVKQIENVSYVLHLFGSQLNASMKTILPNERKQVAGHFAKIHCPVTSSLHPGGLWSWEWCSPR